ncbi:MAG: hypothetical protein V1736_07865 [Pseudomonadota bacterium]
MGERDQKLASIDVGTNTIRLWIGRIEPRKIVTLHTELANVRLGEGIDRDGAIDGATLSRAEGVLAGFRGVLETHSIKNAKAIGTSVFRRAGNGKRSAGVLSGKIGIEIEIISGEEEVGLCAKGVLWEKSELDASNLIVDVGGGSTEFIRVRGERLKAVQSLDFGAVYLTDTYLKHDPPLPEETEKIRRCIASELSKLKNEFEYCADEGCRIIGTAGTATTLAAMDLALSEYDSGLINGHVLKLDKLKDLSRRLGALKAEERMSIPGLDKGREDIIFAGLAAWITIMETFSQQEMTVSHYGILEGAAIDLWERLQVCPAGTARI